MADDGVVVTTGRQVSREPYRGRYRTNRRTGERQVWNGSGYVPETAASLAPEAAAALQAERNELSRDNDAVRFTNQFLELNAQEPSGAFWHGHIPFLQDPSNPMTVGNARVQQMFNIQNRFVRSNIREGTSGAGNTGPEQMRIERSGPSLAFSGPANRGVALNLQIDRDLRVARISAMEQWARDPQRRSLEGFEQWWAENSNRIRAGIQSRYEQTNGPVAAQADRDGRQRPNPQPQRPPNVPADARWDAQRQRWVR